MSKRYLTEDAHLGTVIKTLEMANLNSKKHMQEAVTNITAKLYFSWIAWKENPPSILRTLYDYYRNSL